MLPALLDFFLSCYNNGLNAVIDALVLALNFVKGIDNLGAQLKLLLVAFVF